MLDSLLSNPVMTFIALFVIIIGCKLLKVSAKIIKWIILIYFAYTLFTVFA